VRGTERARGAPSEGARFVGGAVWACAGPEQRPGATGRGDRGGSGSGHLGHLVSGPSLTEPSRPSRPSGTERAGAELLGERVRTRGAGQSQAGASWPSCSPSKRVGRASAGTEQGCSPRRVPSTEHDYSPAAEGPGHLGHLVAGSRAGGGLVLDVRPWWPRPRPPWGEGRPLAGEVRRGTFHHALRRFGCPLRLAYRGLCGFVRDRWPRPG